MGGTLPRGRTAGPSGQVSHSGLLCRCSGQSPDLPGHERLLSQIKSTQSPPAQHLGHSIHRHCPPSGPRNPCGHVNIPGPSVSQEGTCFRVRHVLLLPYAPSASSTRPSFFTQAASQICDEAVQFRFLQEAFPDAPSGSRGPSPVLRALPLRGRSLPCFKHILFI